MPLVSRLMCPRALPPPLPPPLPLFRRCWQVAVAAWLPEGLRPSGLPPCRTPPSPPPPPPPPPPPVTLTRATMSIELGIGFLRSLLRHRAPDGASLCFDTTALSTLQLESIQASPGRITASMPVTDAVANRYGTLHGGCIGACAARAWLGGRCLCPASLPSRKQLVFLAVLLVHTYE